MNIVMHRYCLLFGCALLCLAASVFAQATQAEPEAADELTAVEVQAPPKLITPEQQLAQIELPDNPTREQCEAFLDDIYRIANANGLTRLTELRAKKLATIPAQHIVLLTQIFEAKGLKEGAVLGALGRYEPKSYRQAAIDGFAEDPSLIYLIVRNGWYQDVKDELIDKLKSGYVPVRNTGPIWFQAYVEVAEPEHFELLHKRTLNYDDLRRKLFLLDTLEGYDFARTVNACWANLTPKLRDNGYYDIDNVLRSYAVRVGNIDALASAVQDLVDPQRGYKDVVYNTTVRTIITPELLVRRYLDFRGTHEEVQAWFKANRDDLVFDFFTQRFQLIEDF